MKATAMSERAKMTRDLAYELDCDLPLELGVEPREKDDEGAPRIAVKGGIYTLFTVGDYFDGGYDRLQARLAYIVEAANGYPALAAELASVRADLEAARSSIQNFGSLQHEWMNRVASLEADLDAAREALRAFFAEWDGPVGTYAPTDATQALMRAALAASGQTGETE